jgi:hypothetical protein
VTEQLLAQQLESPSGTGRDETPKSDQPVSPHQHQTRMQTSTRILTGSYGAGESRCGPLLLAVASVYCRHVGEARQDPSTATRSGGPS